MLVKYPLTFDLCCPLFTGGNVPNFGPKFWPQSSSNRRIFELGSFIGKQKQTCQGSMMGLPSYQLPEPLAQWLPKRVKVINLLYILRSSGPRQVHRHRWYTTYWGRSWCKKSTVTYLATHPLQFTVLPFRSSSCKNSLKKISDRVHSVLTVFDGAVLWTNAWQGWVSECVGLTSHSTHNRSYRGRWCIAFELMHTMSYVCV